MFYGGVHHAYQCRVCNRLFLKPTEGMAEWRTAALGSQPGSSARHVAALPSVRCRNGTCDPRFSRMRRAAHCAAPAQVTSTTSLPPPTPAILSASQSPHPPQPQQSPSPQQQPSVPLKPDVHRVLGFDCGLCAAARRSEADALRMAVSAAAQVSLTEEQVRGLHRPSPPSSVVTLGGDVVVEGGHSDAEPSCHVFLEFLISGGFDEAGHDDVLWRIASTILLRRDEDQICVRQSNGRSRVYIHKLRFAIRSLRRARKSSDGLQRDDTSRQPVPS